MGGGAGSGRRPGTALEDDRRTATAARNLRCAGPLGTQYVPDARRRHRSAGRLRQTEERRQPAAVDEISLRRRPDLFRQGRCLQSEIDPQGALQLQGRVRSRARQQARHHRHPVPIHDGLRGACGRRQGQRPRARQEIAAGMQECRDADLSDQRGVRARPEVRGVRHRRDVEGARRAVAERGYSRDRRCPHGRRTRLHLRLRDPEERAQQGRRLRLSGRHAGQERAGSVCRRHGLQPHRHQRRGRARSKQAHRLHARRRSANSSISTTTT